MNTKEPKIDIKQVARAMLKEAHIAFSMGRIEVAKTKIECIERFLGIRVQIDEELEDGE